MSNPNSQGFFISTIILTFFIAKTLILKTNQPAVYNKTAYLFKIASIYCIFDINNILIGTK